ncbi:MotA/TolQ/ExbB proton channel family protein [Riemerella anatipestifer]|uniref:MotA/TolQ/ExbB proton channel family protein n=2 Tax=Riemerella anatipestifer TaxID=34085 RepID=A0AAP6HFS3_RIEAN|nr:MotA/TolQ/ExbB proton channel family protein [Riemerella anatipestifer]ADQ82111.1 outer membrane transport energization protein ExbB [Riemerella anatipestifer ATCC 11845 = DSM 15868]ADZ12390.1 ExbD1 [Riemerella anatipestifer RA-GD]AGC39972.1 Biopolymer transport protein [Riemerella anatipestifer RA-CH-2]AKP69330.1 outer membrane transport energization protein exbb [Riemerella anatipestifer]AKP71218.1 outer membrane transport energization protein exbb [Riemerella anatipestifer]
MEMNVSNTEEQVIARQKSGLNPAVVLPILYVIALSIYIFILGNPGNFKEDARIAGQASVAFADIPSKELHPESFMGIIYMGGPVVHILILFMITVIVFSFERFFVIKKAQGKGNLDKFVLDVRRLLNQNKIDEAIELCDAQQGSVGNVVKEGLVTYKALANDSSMDKEKKMVALTKALEEATTLEMPMLEKNMMILSTLGTVATLVALLGTVIGMIKAFFALGSGGGTPDAAALSIGISEALINTALGIGTSAIAIILYNFFTSKIDGLTYKIDEIGMSIQQSFAEFN